MLLYGENSLAFEKPGKGRSHREKALQFVDSIKILDGTDIFASLQRAFDLCGGAEAEGKPKLGGFDTIFLISDGVVTRGVMEIPRAIEQLTEMNRFRKIAIHTIGVMAPSEGEDYLKALSDVTGGTYTRR
jgi:hypothetical protein